MRAIFKDKSHQDQFDNKGFVKLSLLDSHEVKTLLGFYQKQNFNNKIEGGFHISLDNADQELVTSVGDRIKEVIAPKAKDFLDDCQVFTSSFVIKEPGLKNIVPPHQDWTFVDEDKFCSATLWTPLMDVTEENGALGVIPSSHKLFNHPRSSPSPQSKSALADHVFTLFPFVEIVEMKAGETLIFNNKLIHASPPNLTDSPRIAVGIGITQKEAKLRHYYHIPNSKPAQLEVYEVEQEFYTYYNNKRLSDLYDNGKSPEKLKKLDTVERITPDLSKEEMESLIKTIDGIQENLPLMENLAKLFNYNTKDMEPQKSGTESKTVEVANKWDNRTFFQKYSPGNIIKEIIWRLKGRK
ncbi:MAG: hypothetical protein ACI857_000271 [Arenicella sp.]|jgi:hypothetical protein